MAFQHVNLNKSEWEGKMKKVAFLITVGVFLFMTGISLSTKWVIVGTTLSIIGSFMVGGSSYFLINTKNKRTPE